MEAAPESQSTAVRRVFPGIFSAIWEDACGGAPKPASGRLRQAMPVALALAAGLTMRLWMLKRFFQVDVDELIYGGLAKNLLLHGQYALEGANGAIYSTLIRLPGYPLFLALCFRLFGMENYASAAWVQIGLELAGCLLLADFAGRIAPPEHSRRAALATLWLAALCPFTAIYDAQPLTEALTLFAIVLALWSAVRFRERPAWGSALCFTFAVSFAALLRPDGALVGATLAPALAWGLRRKIQEQKAGNEFIQSVNVLKGLGFSRAAAPPPTDAALEAAEKLMVLKGHGFSRAVNAAESTGTLAPERSFSGKPPAIPPFSAGCKALTFFRSLTARLKSCPFKADKLFTRASFPVAGKAPACNLRPAKLARMAVICLLLALAPFAAWSWRNWQVFHVFQPLVTRYATDPGEDAYPGWQRWMKTWSLDFVSTSEVYWPVPGEPLEMSKLPSRAFDSPAEYAETAALAADYNDRDNAADILPDVDARFAKLAEERIRAHPLRYYLWLPLGRLADMWLRPRVENLPIELDWWVYERHDAETRFSWGYAGLNALYLLLALAGLRMRPRLWPWMLAYLVLRSALIMTIEAPETRYSLECFPMLFALGGVAVAGVWRRVAAFCRMFTGVRFNSF